MIPQEIKESTPLIAEFLGYKYYKKVLVDFSDCGGIYDWTDVYSKVPIEVDDYPEDEQCYFKDDWVRDNYSNYIFNPCYHGDWNQLMEVLERVNKYSIIEINYSLLTTCRICYLGENKYSPAINFYGDSNEGRTPIEAIYTAIVEFIEHYKTKNSEK